MSYNDSYIVKDNNGNSIELVHYAEKVVSKANAHIIWLIDFRPFRIISEKNDSPKVYLADDTEYYNYHIIDEEFIQNYSPTIHSNEYNVQTCDDIKLPSGRWLEKVTVDLEDGNIIINGTIDAFGTYNEQR